MAGGQLKKLLKEKSGYQRFEFVIPHPLLPPRYKKISSDRNMILQFDENFTIHVRWEGQLLHEYHSITPKATIHLIKEVCTSMVRYRKDLKTFAEFVGEYGEQPFELPAYNTPRKCKPAIAPLEPREEKEEDIEIAVVATIYEDNEPITSENENSPPKETTRV